MLAGLVLELGHPVEPAEARDAVEDPGQLGMGRHGRLGEDHRLLRVDPGGEVGRGDLPGLVDEVLRVLPLGDRVHVDHAVETLHLVLQAHELHQGAEIVAQVQVAGGLDAGKHALGARIGGRGLIGHGLGPSWKWRSGARSGSRAAVVAFRRFAIAG